jgi:glycogen debranching enzyme
LTRVASSAKAPCEWLVANGLGGYASATITGAITRRYQGVLIAAQPAPLGRMVVLNDLEVDIEREHGSVVNARENGRFLDFHAEHGAAELAIRNRRHFDRAIDRSCRCAKTSCIRRFARSATVSEPACG